MVWVTCAVGMAWGAGLSLLGAAVTVGHFITVYVYTLLSRRIGGARSGTWEVRLVVYHTGLGVLPQVLSEWTRRGYEVVDVRVSEDGEEPAARPDDGREGGERPGPVLTRVLQVSLRLRGAEPVHPLVGDLSEVTGVQAAACGDAGEPAE